jgi:hypothetical protein
VPATLEGNIRAYARRVDAAACYVESAELSALLAGREAIRDDLRDGAALDDGIRRVLHNADNGLRAKADILARQFPGFDAAAVIREVIGEDAPDLTRAERTA